MADRPVGLRDVLVLAGACVVVVLGAAILTSFLPADAQGVVFRTPLLIVVLIVGTGWLLWRISRTRPTLDPPAPTAPTSPDESIADDRS